MQLQQEGRVVFLAISVALLTADVSDADVLPGRFGRPRRVLPEIPWGATPIEAHLSPDGLMMYFAQTNGPGGYGQHDLYQVTRATTDDVFDFGDVINLGPGVNSARVDLGPMVSEDGLRIYFYRDWNRIYMASRT